MQQNAAVANNWAQLGSGISSAAGSLAAAYLMDGGNIFGNNAGSFTPNTSVTTGSLYNTLKPYIGAPK